MKNKNRRILEQQKDIILDLDEFFSLKDQTVFIVTVPYMRSQNTFSQCGSTFITCWNIGGTYTEYGDPIKENISNIKGYEDLYNVDSKREIERNNVIYRGIINLKEYNLLGKTAFLNAIFKTKSGANGYRLWIKLNYKPDSTVSTLNPNTFRGRLVCWEDFRNNGLIKTEHLEVYR